MRPPKRSNPRIEPEQFDRKGSFLHIYGLTKGPNRAFNWINLLIGLALIGLIPLFVIATEFALDKRLDPPPPTMKAFSQNMIPSPTAQAAIIAMQVSSIPSPTLTLAPSLTPTKIPNTATSTIPTASPTPTDSCPEQQGQVLEKSFNSRIAGSAVPYRIYLPPCYAQSNRRYPYVILLHGVGSDETEWTDGLGVNRTLDEGIRNGTLSPMILVMPNGGELQYDNYFAEGASFEALVLNDLMPEIESNYCTLNTQAGRALGGISRGGFWVFEIGFLHPDVFGKLGGHSAFLIRRMRRLRIIR